MTFLGYSIITSHHTKKNKHHFKIVTLIFTNSKMKNSIPKRCKYWFTSLNFWMRKKYNKNNHVYIAPCLLMSHRAHNLYDTMRKIVLQKWFNRFFSAHFLVHLMGVGLQNPAELYTHPESEFFRSMIFFNRKR